jgi:tetratricopeptide (TPR) repeat protein
MPLSPGDLLANKYRIEAEIGRGAFGRVYRARDIALDRVVAVKELHKGEDDLGSTQFADYVRRFEREARIQARFNHPNIVHVYELIQEGADRLYLVMELVDGESLRDHLARRGLLPVDEAVRIAGDLLAGLAVVHTDERDIVHRDIKPSNVMLTRGGQAKLTDFGLAQVGDESMRSKDGKLHPGTPAYMSPEQETTSAYLYPASDVFSAGCVLFELLTGLPYKQAKRRKQGLADLRSDTPLWLAEVVVAALAKDPDDRPADAGDLARLMRESEAKEKAEAEAARQADQQRKEREAADARQREAEAEMARQADLRRKVQEAEQARLREEEERRRAEAHAKAEAAERARQAEQASAEARQREAEAVQRREADARAQRDAEAKAQEAAQCFERGKSYHNKGDYDRAITDYTKAIELDPAKADYYFGRGTSCAQKKNYDRAIADHTKAIELDPAKADYYFERGTSYAWKDDYDRAIADHTKAIELDPAKADYYFGRGTSYHNQKVHTGQGDYDRAIADQNKAIELDSHNGKYYHSRGLTYRAKGDTARADADEAKARELGYKE